MQVVSDCAVGWRKGMMAQVGARALGRGFVNQWHREVYVRMARTALIFSALQPVRPVVVVPFKQYVMPGRVSRGNYSNLQLMRQCATTEPPYGAANSVLVEARECPDGSIMYKFGTSDQKAEINSDTQEISSDSIENGRLQETDAGDLGELGTGNERPTDSVFEQELPGTNAELYHIEEKLLHLKLEEQDVTSAGENGSVRVEVSLDSQESSAVPESKREDVISETPTEEVNKSIAFQFSSGAAMIPHPEKAARGGEDAYFIEGNHWVGVADGVGGWALEGVNAGHYARELMWHCAELARETDYADPKTLLVKSFSKTQAKGSTTAVIASVKGQTLNVANMGDTGFVVVRDGEALTRSTPMQRGFNFPYQIGSIGDDPLLAEVYRVDVRVRDVVILGSDGLFDNLFESEIVSIVNRLLQAGSKPENIAKELIEAAFKIGASHEGTSPFAKEAQAVGYSYTGGKMDDITCVVAVIS